MIVERETLPRVRFLAGPETPSRTCAQQRRLLTFLISSQVYKRDSRGEHLDSRRNLTGSIRLARSFIRNR